MRVLSALLLEHSYAARGNRSPAIAASGRRLGRAIFGEMTDLTFVSILLQDLKTRNTYSRYSACILHLQQSVARYIRLRRDQIV